MSDPLTEADVEQRLRRAFALRALDAPRPDATEPADDTDDGDGADVLAFPTAVTGQARRVRPATDRGNRTGARGWARRPRALGLAAAALLVAAGVATSLLGADAPNRATTTGDPGDAPAPTTAATPTTTAVPAGDEDYAIALYQRGDDVLHVEFVAGTGAAPEGAEQVAVGDREARLSTAEDGRLRDAYLLVDGGTVVLRSAGMARQELLDVAARVSQDRTSGGYSVPPPVGWEAVWTSGPGRVDPEVAGGLTDAEQAALDRLAHEPLDVEGRPLGDYARPVGPGRYDVAWFPGASRPDTSPSAAPVVVGDWAGTLDAITGADGVERLALWVFFDHGAARVEATGLTEDEVLAAGELVLPDGRPAGGVVAEPLPGFVDAPPAG